MFDKIMVPLDGSKLAEQVLPHVMNMARAFGSQVILVSVCETDEIESERMCQAYIDNKSRLLAGAPERDQAVVRGLMLKGRPAHEIVEYAEKNGINLLILSSHGRSGVVPMRLGSTADRLLRSIGVPLLIFKVTGDENEERDLFHIILVPLDGSENGEAVLPYAMELHNRLKSRIVLTRTVEPGKHVHTLGGLNYVYFKDQHVDNLKQEAQEYLEKTIARLSVDKTAIKCEVRIGDPQREIIKCADESKAGLIALTSHMHSAIERWVFGSVTYKVLHSANTSVLLVPYVRHNS